MAECTVREQCDYEESNSVILEPLRLIVDMTRNITLPTKAFPNVDISLSLDAIKVVTLLKRCLSIVFQCESVTM